MSMKNKLKAAAGVVSVAAGGAANAAGTSIDMSSMTGSVDASTVVAAIVAFGVIYIGPGFAKWAVKKVGSFFG
ncbi:hypothetical protein [Ralstonia sp. ASV6]|uniref:hypothetical protein n=1 Tax=Ralstonia sp. ASV6 TaxID=2795124 RepID=UPI0018EB9B2B|nr:hypothetical protein [Ralstonia sp. ASV6]